MEKKILTGSKAVVTSINTNLEDKTGVISLRVEAYNEDQNEAEKLNPMNITDVEILEERRKVDATFGLEGELLVGKNRDMIISIDLNGDLVISDEYAANYSINDQGELIYQR